MVSVGEVLDGKVMSVMPFGAFVEIGKNVSGLVHISEVSNTYVSDIRQHLTEGQDVKVVVLSIDGNKVNLSIKRLEARPQREAAPRPAQPRPQAPRTPTPPPAPKTADQLFEEKLKQFMSESDSKISSIRQYSEHRTKSRRR